MKYKISLIILLILLIPLAVTAAIALASEAVQNDEGSQTNFLPGQAFTYQGQLLDDGQPEPGPCDFQFGLYGSPSLGDQLGITQTLTNVPLDSGRFTVLLNDGGAMDPEPFGGQDVFLAISVACPTGSGNYVALSPRQNLTPAPYSHYSMDAGNVPWEGITGMPDGFSDGVDDDTQYSVGTGLEQLIYEFQIAESYRLPQTCAANQFTVWSGAGWECHELSSGGSPYENVVVVAKSGGDFDTVQGALDGITDASSDSPYLVWVAPGVYSETVAMKPYVDIEGAGQNLTKIQSPGGTINEATVEAATHSSLRSLTVENFGQADDAIAILSESDDFTISSIDAICSGGTVVNECVYLRSDLPITNTIRDTTITVAGDVASSYSNGLRVTTQTGSEPGVIRLTLDNVDIEMTGSGSSLLHGLFQLSRDDSISIITATNLNISSINTGSGAGRGIYVYGPGSSTLNIANSEVYALGGSNFGMFVGRGARAIVRNTSMEASYDGLQLGRVLDSPASADVDGSKISGGTNAVRTTGTGGGNVVNIGSSLLDGLIVIEAGDTVTCVASYDENYTNVNGFLACP